MIDLSMSAGHYFKMQSIEKETVMLELLTPLKKAFKLLKSSRDCIGLSDWDYLRSGIGRVLESSVSGREWIQRAHLHEIFTLSVSRFFDALKSKRRALMVKEFSSLVTAQVDSSNLTKYDPLAEHSELDKFACFASDGHCHKCSAHEDKIKSKKRPVSHIMSLNLRSHSLSYLTTCIPNEGKKKKHEITAIKDLKASDFRMNQPKGKKVIHAYDPAIIDYFQWTKWKNSYGIYIITREKNNSALQTIGLRAYDQEDPRNEGVLKDEIVGSGNSCVALRRVTYKDPATETIYRFITNEMTLPPGLIALIYKLRWDIEKVFEETKIKLGENKSWAKSDASKSQHALFMCILHNAMLLLERTIENKTAITDEKSRNKQAKRQERQRDQIIKAGRNPNEMVLSLQRVTQRSLQFIRWLRNEIISKNSWDESIRRLRPLMKAYLT